MDSSGGGHESTHEQSESGTTLLVFDGVVRAIVTVLCCVLVCARVVSVAFGWLVAQR